MIRPLTMAFYIGHDGATYYGRKDVVEIDGEIGRVLYVDPCKDVLTVDFFGVWRRSFWRARAWLRGRGREMAA